MFRQPLRMGSALYVVASAVLLMSSTSVGGAEGPTVEVKVAGTPAQLAAFDKVFRPSVGSEPLGCLVMVNGAVSSCDALKTTPVPPTASDLTYEFIGSHTTVYEKVGYALNQVQPTFHPNLPSVTIRRISPPDPDCSAIPGCLTAPYCIQYGRCSKSQTQCIKC